MERRAEGLVELILLIVVGVYVPRYKDEQDAA